MKPVAILQHEASQGPGILLDHLRQQEIAHVLIDPCAEGAAPANARDYRGIGGLEKMRLTTNDIEVLKNVDE